MMPGWTLASTTGPREDRLPLMAEKSPGAALTARGTTQEDITPMYGKHSEAQR